jgi:eight-cysteine-cluster-containing protein
MERAPYKEVLIYSAVTLVVIIISLGGYLLLLSQSRGDGESSFSPSDPAEYYGYSTHDSCNKDNKCVVGGCNQEICQGEEKEAMVSICLKPDKPTPKELGYRCQCLNSECQWAKE